MQEFFASLNFFSGALLTIGVAFCTPAFFSAAADYLQSRSLRRAKAAFPKEPGEASVEAWLQEHDR